jgi:hypothetical protein
MTPASPARGHNQARTWLAAVSPLLRHINMRTLAFLMFVGFVLLNTTDGKQAETKESTFAETTKIDLGDSGHNEAAHVPTEPTGHRMSASSVLWQFMRSIVNAFKSALNDPWLSEYAKQQGLDVSDSLTTACPNTSQPFSTPSKSLSSQSSKPLSSY